MKRLNIGLVTPGFSAAEDDWCIPALLNVVRELSHAHDVTVYTLRYPHVNRTYPVFNATVRAFGGATAAAWHRLPLLWRAVHTIVHDAQRRPFSHLHGFWADEAGFVAAAAARYLRIPSVVSLMGGELVGFPDLAYGVQLSRSGRWLTRLSLRLAHTVTAGSRQLQDRAALHLGPSRVALLPVGVDTARFTPASSPDALSPPQLIHVASLVPVKEQRTLLEAFAQIVPLFPTATLHIVGNGPMRPALEKMAHTCHVQQQVHFHGDVAHDRLPALYQKSDLFVLSSRYESQNLAVLEAAACGVPAVGTTVGLLPELLPPKCLAPPGDANALAQAMQHVLADETHRQALARELHQQVVTHYRLDQTIARLLALYGALS